MRLVFVIAATFLLVQIIQNSVAEEGEGEETDTEVEEPERTCQKYIYDMLMGTLNAVLACLGGKFQMRSIFDIGKRFYCLFRCILTELGVLGEDGKLDEVSALFYFESSVPPSILDTVVTGSQPCLDMAGSFDPSQYYCQSYGPFAQCVITSLGGTVAPFALNCFSSPGLGFLFSVINLIVPQAPPPAASSATARQIRKRYREAQLRKNNGTLNVTKLVASKNRGSSKTITLPGNVTIPPFKPIPTKKT